MFGVSDNGWVAIGTLSLALVTVAVGVVSAIGVRATFAEVAGSLRPLLAEVPIGHPVGGGPAVTGIPGRGRNLPSAWEVVVETAPAMQVSVPFRNVGPGAAVIDSVEFVADTNESAPASGWASARILPPREAARANGGLTEGARDRLWVTVTYRDVRGKQPASTRLFLHRQEGDSWAVVGVAADTPSGNWVTSGATWWGRANVP